MAGSLKRRLSRMRELGLTPASKLNAGRPSTRGGGAENGPSPRPAHATPDFLAAWERAAEFVWTRTIVKPDPLPAFFDPAPFVASTGRRSSAPPAESARNSAFPSGKIDTSRLVFFDLETTGLSGGAGTIAFLAAVARRDGGSLELRQFFLADYPGEPEYLDEILRQFSEECILVTYNGSSFDLPLLRTRCVINGRRPPSLPHIDVLFAARRLWKRVYGGAALGLLERGLLGREREEDVPGSMIPGLYFSYLRTGEEKLMNAVMSHNADDVSSLAAVLSRAISVFDDPRRHCGSSLLDRAGLGRSLVAVGRCDEGEELLEAALGDGDESAGLLLSKLYRRAGRYDDWARIVAMLPDSFRADLERARFFERCAGDFHSALAWARKARRLAPTEAKAAQLDARISRLKTRLGENRPPRK
jgi:hypothetical protein